MRVTTLGPGRSSPDYYALEVLDMLLGGTGAARLHQNLNARNGYAYKARSTIEWRPDVSMFIAHTTVDTDVTGATLRELANELAALRGDIPEAEIERAKGALRNSQPEAFLRMDHVAKAVAELFLSGLPLDAHADYARRIDAVTADDLRRVAEKYFDLSSMAFVVAGHQDAIERRRASTGDRGGHDRRREGSDAPVALTADRSGDGGEGRVAGRRGALFLVSALRITVPRPVASARRAFAPAPPCPLDERRSITPLLPRELTYAHCSDPWRHQAAAWLLAVAAVAVATPAQTRVITAGQTQLVIQESPTGFQFVSASLAGGFTYNFFNTSPAVIAEDVWQVQFSRSPSTPLSPPCPLLGRPVDLVPIERLKPRVRDQILREAIRAA